MTDTLHTSNLGKLSQFENAVFYCMNQSSERVPVCVVRNISVLSDNRLEFSLSHFPVIENFWNVFACELYFYKKGIFYSMNVHGTAWFKNTDDLTVQFKVLYIETAGSPEIKPYSFQDSIVEFFSNTSLFFKKMIVSGF
jgi:hypothetical protein